MVEDLIYDVGMHDGSDTAYYLHRGYRVVAVEANPVLVEQARERFRAELGSGRLTIVNAGIAPEEGTRTFWVNDDNSEWSSFERDVGCRDGSRCHPVEVPGARFRHLLAEHGVPFYLKIDIETADIHCLRDLRAFDLPRYVSVEAHSLLYLAILASLGYNAFKCVNQADHNHPVVAVDNESRAARLREFVRSRPGLAGTLRALGAGALWRLLKGRGAGPAPATGPPDPDAGATASGGWVFSPGSSGPFGEDTPGEWRDLEDLAYDWLHLRLGHRDRGTLDREGWHDFHATVR